jgi:hypothetical protein
MWGMKSGRSGIGGLRKVCGIGYGGRIRWGFLLMGRMRTRGRLGCIMEYGVLLDRLKCIDDGHCRIIWLYEFDTLAKTMSDLVDDVMGFDNCWACLGT